MRTWLLMAIDPEERLYQGHSGYDDDLRILYRYDSFVPNHRNIAVGDAVIVRDKRQVIGCAVIEAISEQPGLKRRYHCPVCGDTRLKKRVLKMPKYRCECGAEFDTAEEQDAKCTKFEVRYGDSYHDLRGEVSIAALWALAPRLNKQLAILELDASAAATLLVSVCGVVGRADEPPLAARALFTEGQRIPVLVNRYERDPRARRACLDHYGTRCVVCGMSFAECYGEIGEGVIEVHHLELLSGSRDVRTIDPVRDLRPLCSNCHTMVHRRSPPLGIDELKARVGMRM